jgi:hypothetical protein
MFNRETVQKILEECEEALKAVAERHGLNLLRKHCSYNEGEMPVAFKLVVREGEGSQASRDEADFKNYATLVGLEPSAFGATFRSGGRMFKVAGLNPRAHRFPIIAEDERGKRFRFPAETVKALVEVGAGV